MNHWVFTTDPVELQVSGMGPFADHLCQSGGRSAHREVAPDAKRGLSRV